MHVLRRALIPLLSSVLAACMPAHAAQVAIVQGDQQSAAVGEEIPEPLTVRLTDDDGDPLAGADVIFFVDECIETQPVAGDACPPPTSYPRFASDRWFVNVLTDAQGLATSPHLRAGLDIGTFQIAAGAPDSSSGWARFGVVQVEGPGRPIGAELSGTWIDPARPGQGLLLEVLEDGRLLAFWLGYRPDGGGLAWFGGDASFRRNIATIGMRMAEPGPDPASLTTSPWGFMVLRFPECDRALVDYWSYDPAWGEGSMVLSRLTRIAGTNCP